MRVSKRDVLEWVESAFLGESAMERQLALSNLELWLRQMAVELDNKKRGTG